CDSVVLAPPEIPTGTSSDLPPAGPPTNTPTNTPASSAPYLSPDPALRHFRLPGELVDRSLFTPTGHELSAAIRLTDLFQACLKTIRQPLPDDSPLIKQADFWPALLGLPWDTAAENCLTTARRTQLASFVAPPALLFISGSVAADPRPGLSSAAITRIVLA